MLFAMMMVLAPTFLDADIWAWNENDILCQPPSRNEQACLKREEIGLILENAGLKAYARPSNGPYWEVYWK